MENKSKRRVGRNDPCPCGSDKKYKKCCFLNRRPKMGTIRLAYKNGTNDPFMFRMLFQILKIRDFAYKDQDKMAFDKKHGVVFQNLYEAKIVKENCERLIQRHSEEIETGKICEYDSGRDLINIRQTIDNELNIFFKDFFIRGRMTMNGLVKLVGHMGYSISFVFIVDSKKYLKKKNKFLQKNNNERCIDFVRRVEENRQSWLLPFINTRDSIEHDGFKIAQIQYVLNRENQINPLYPVISSQRVDKLINVLWENLFSFCENVIVFFLGFKLKSPFGIMFIPEEKRDQKNPMKYVVVLSKSHEHEIKNET